MTATLKVAVIAGEVSGDLLGADLIRSLKGHYSGSIELMGVGGEALEAQGLVSLFDYSELSIMGFTQVLKKLPKLISRINQTAQAIIVAKPDMLLIIDSPDFTHRVAKKYANNCRICRLSIMSAPASGRGRNIAPPRCCPMSITFWPCFHSSRRRCGVSAARRQPLSAIASASIKTCSPCGRGGLSGPCLPTANRKPFCSCRGHVPPKRPG